MDMYRIKKHFHQECDSFAFIAFMLSVIFMIIEIPERSFLSNNISNIFSVFENYDLIFSSK